MPLGGRAAAAVALAGGLVMGLGACGNKGYEPEPNATSVPHPGTSELVPPSSAATAAGRLTLTFDDLADIPGVTLHRGHRQGHVDHDEA